jgi:hypothetical protein
MQKRYDADVVVYATQRAVRRRERDGRVADLQTDADG